MSEDVMKTRMLAAMNERDELGIPGTPTVSAVFPEFSNGNRKYRIYAVCGKDPQSGRVAVYLQDRLSAVIDKIPKGHEGNVADSLKKLFVTLLMTRGNLLPDDCVGMVLSGGKFFPDSHDELAALANDPNLEVRMLKARVAALEKLLAKK